MVFLIAALLAMALAKGLSAGLRHRRRVVLRRLAGQWRMNYSPADHLRLTDRVGVDFPIPGAARVVVRDLLYGTEGQHRRYIFTLEFTHGVIYGTRRVARGGAMNESCEHGGEFSKLVLAPEGMSVTEQYEWLHGEGNVNRGEHGGLGEERGTADGRG